MSIVSSTYTLDNHTQIDGRRYVTELHTDHIGVAHLVEYLAPIGADYQSIANARADSIALALAEAEAEELLNG